MKNDLQEFLIQSHSRDATALDYFSMVPNLVAIGVDFSENYKSRMDVRHRLLFEHDEDKSEIVAYAENGELLFREVDIDRALLRAHEEYPESAWDDMNSIPKSSTDDSRISILDKRFPTHTYRLDIYGKANAIFEYLEYKETPLHKRFADPNLGIEFATTFLSYVSTREMPDGDFIIDWDTPTPESGYDKDHDAEQGGKFFVNLMTPSEAEQVAANSSEIEHKKIYGATFNEAYVNAANWIIENYDMRGNRTR